MYIVLYVFKIRPNLESDFIDSWKALTQLIYKYQGSLGSRLHRKSSQEYIAYAQWPNKSKFKAPHNKLPNEAKYYRELMRSSCYSIEILDKFQVVEDELATTPYEV